jgi:hypothetical protein
MFAKVVKQQHAGRPTTAWTLLTSKMTAEEGTIGTSWMSREAGLPESDNRRVSNSTAEKTAIFSRNTSSSSKNSPRTFATIAETIGTSQTSTAEGSPTTAGMPEIVKMPQKQKY